MPKRKYLLLQRSPMGKSREPSPAQMQDMYAAFNAWKEKFKDEILDIFGSEDSFSTQRGNCFMPGMGVSLARPNAPPVDLLISLSCNQAQGDGFTWPYPKNGFTTETHEKLSQIYQKLWGPVPPGA